MERINFSSSIQAFNGSRYNTSSRESTLQLTRTNVNHLVGDTDPPNYIGAHEGFGNILLSQLDTTNNLEKNVQNLVTQFTVDPESVNEHDITTASTEATLAINITTLVLNKAIEAYKSIMSL